MYPNPLVLPAKQEKTMSEDNYVCIAYPKDIVGAVVQPSQTYDVYAMILNKGNTYYLIDNGQDNIQFFPSALFEITTNTFQEDWRIYEYHFFDYHLMAIGPSVFVGSYKAICDIINESKEVMYKFLQYKAYYSEWGCSPFSD